LQTIAIVVSSLSINIFQFHLLYQKEPN